MSLSLLTINVKLQKDGDEFVFAIFSCLGFSWSNGRWITQDEVVWVSAKIGWQEI